MVVVQGVVAHRLRPAGRVATKIAWWALIGFCSCRGETSCCGRQRPSSDPGQPVSCQVASQGLLLNLPCIGACIRAPRRAVDRCVCRFQTGYRHWATLTDPAMELRSIIGNNVQPPLARPPSESQSAFSTLSRLSTLKYQDP